MRVCMNIRIPPLAMIDDVLAVTKCGIDSIEVNSLINMKVEAKKLRLSDEKCILINGIKSCEPCDNNLKVHKKNMKKKRMRTYLGEINTADGKLDETVDQEGGGQEIHLLEHGQLLRGLG